MATRSIQNNVDMYVTDGLNNEHVYLGVIFFLIFYAALIAPRLSYSVLKWFNNWIIQVALFCAVVYLSHKNATMGLIAAIAVLVTIMYAYDKSSKRKMLYSGITNNQKVRKLADRNRSRDRSMNRSRHRSRSTDRSRGTNRSWASWNKSRDRSGDRSGDRSRDESSVGHDSMLSNSLGSLVNRIDLNGLKTGIEQIESKFRNYGSNLRSKVNSELRDSRLLGNVESENRNSRLRSRVESEYENSNRVNEYPLTDEELVAMEQGVNSFNTESDYVNGNMNVVYENVPNTVDTVLEVDNLENDDNVAAIIVDGSGQNMNLIDETNGVMMGGMIEDSDIYDSEEMDNQVITPISQVLPPIFQLGPDMSIVTETVEETVKPSVDKITSEVEQKLGLAVSEETKFAVISQVRQNIVNMIMGGRKPNDNDVIRACRNAYRKLYG